MKRFDANLNLIKLNPILFGKLNAQAIAQLHGPVGPAASKLSKNAAIRNFLGHGSSKISAGSSGGSSSAQPTSGVAYILMLLSSALLLTGWFGSWMGNNNNDGGLATPTPSLLTTIHENKTSVPPIPRAKYGCSFGYQGRLCDPCGVQPVVPNIKIVGGIEAIPHSWPAHALITHSYAADVYFDQFNKTVLYNWSMEFICGGSLITRDTVLTAAHCIDDYETPDNIFAEYNGTYLLTQMVPNNYYPTVASRYSVILGAHNQTTAIEGVPPATIVRAVYVQVHPEFDLDGNLNNDLAIIKLEREVELNDYIQLSCLPDPSKPDYPTDYGEATYAMGWGTTSQGGNVSETLQNVQLELLDGATQCYPNNSQYDWSTQICSGILTGGKDTCQGDSGGPLYVLDQVVDLNGVPSEKFIQAGIVSFGAGCANPDSPGIYTRVSAYFEWIQGFL